MPLFQHKDGILPAPNSVRADATRYRPRSRSAGQPTGWDGWHDAGLSLSEFGSMLNRAANSLAGLAGFEMIAKWRLRRLAHARQLQRLFKHFGITSVIDVGANAGQFRDQIRDEVGFAGPIYSFEPDPALVAALMCRAVADPAWTVFPCALGASAGTMALNVMENSEYNSFHAPDAQEADHAAYGNRVMRTVEVEVRTLDFGQRQHTGSRPCLFEN